VAALTRDIKALERLWSDDFAGGPVARFTAIEIDTPSNTACT